MKRRLAATFTAALALGMTAPAAVAPAPAQAAVDCGRKHAVRLTLRAAEPGAVIGSRLRRPYTVKAATKYRRCRDGLLFVSVGGSYDLYGDSTNCHGNPQFQGARINLHVYDGARDRTVIIGCQSDGADGEKRRIRVFVPTDDPCAFDPDGCRWASIDLEAEAMWGNGIPNVHKHLRVTVQ